MESMLKKKLIEYFSAQPMVALAYFFGSRARGDAGPMSDYDFAIYAVGEATARERDELRLTTIVALGKIIGTDAIDVVMLNDCYALELKYQIIAQGELLFEREPYQVVVEPRILNEYFDFKYMLRKYHLTKS